MALAQEFYEVLMTEQEIADEAERLLAMGITHFPPREGTSVQTA